MNDKTAVNRTMRLAGAMAVAAAVAVLATACGGSGTTSASSISADPTFGQELAVAQCMRSHGAPDFPDPSASAGFSLNQATLDSSQVQTAYGACRHLLPGGGPSIAALQQEAQHAQQKVLPALVKFSQCMRSHGVPNYPDPTLNGGTIPPLAPGAGINPTSPQFRAAVSACHQEMPAGSHLKVSTSGTEHTS